MITTIDHRDESTAKAIQSIQRPAYRIEAELMGFDGIPHITETVEEIQQSSEIFLGFTEGYLKGFILYYLELKINKCACIQKNACCGKPLYRR